MTTALPIQDHLQALARYSHLLCRSSADAADLVQDTVERALEKAHLYQPDTNLRAWLCTIMRNIAIDRGRKVAKRREEALDGIDVPVMPSADALVDAKRFLRAFPRLAPDERQILMLIADGFAYDEIGRAMGIPVGTVRSRLFRARKTLRSLMESGACSMMGAVIDVDDGLPPGIPARKMDSLTEAVLAAE